MAVDPDRAKVIFLAASELDAANRAAYLDRECGGDAELRARVEALLRADDAASLPPQGDANRTGVYTPNELNPGADQEMVSARIGAVLAGKYRLVEEIGEGGMGSVYLAEQTEPVKRQVALKLIKSGMDSKAVLARFDAERQALALMDHPNIARIYDGGVTPAGQPFFVMELVKGAPLTDYCDRQRLSVNARLQLFVSVCQAVQHAHQKGIIHRDLKPGNVLVTEVDGRPTPKVIDFGVARATDRKLTDVSFADTGAIVGTPAYMSPEQADPTLMDIDTRTDVYALGVILYELLAGSPPIDAKQFKQGAILEMLRMVREVDPPKPSTKLSSAEDLPSIAANRSAEPAKLAIELRGELDWVVMKAIEKDRSRRYESANAFARDLQRYLADDVVEARPPSTGYRLKKFVRRHKGQVIAASLVLVALLGGIVGTTLGLLEARSQEEKARGETAEKEKARSAEAERVVERDKALKAEAERSDELRHRLGVSATILASVAFEARDMEQAALRLEQVPVEQRGWEWRYLKQHTSGGAFTLPGLGQGFWGAENTAVAFSPDGERIVTGIRDTNNSGALRVWDARTGLMLSEFKGIKRSVTSAIFSADGARIVTLEYPPIPPESDVKLWDAKTGNLVFELKKPRDAVHAIALSPDGGRLVTGGDRVKVWDLRTGETVVELDLGKRDPDQFPDPTRQLISGVAFSPDGKRIAACSLRGELKIWDAQKGGAATFTANLPPLPMNLSLYSVSFSPDGTRLLVGYSNATAKVLDAATGAVQLELKARKRQTFEAFLRMQMTSPQIAAFSPDGSRIVLAGGDSGAPEATVWDARTGTELLALAGHTGSVLSAAFSPDGTRIVTGSEDGTAKVWNAATGAPRFQVGGEQKTMASAFSPVDNRMVIAGKKTTIVDLRTGAVVHEMNGLAGGARCAAYSKDGTRIVIAGGTAGFPGRATVHDARSGTALLQLEGLSGPVNDVTFSPDGAWIVTATLRTLITTVDFKIWDAKTGRMLHDLSKLRQNFTDERGGTIAFSPDGLRFVTGGFDGYNEATVWDSKTLKPLFALKDGRSFVMSVAFRGDGTRILTGGKKTVKMWDAHTGELLPVELQGHAGDILACGFNSEGSRIVTGGTDRTVRIWDARTGTALLELKGHGGFVHHAAFNRDGTRIAAVSEEKEAQLIVWEAPVTTVLPVLRGHDTPVRTATYSPDGSRIVAITQEGTARVWDVRTAAVLFEMTVPNGGVVSAAFTADGSRIVTQEWVMNGQMSEQRTRVRDARTGNDLSDEKIPEAVPARPISPDGRHYAHVIGTRIEFIVLKPDEEELVRRRRQTMPDVLQLRRAFEEARGAKDEFAARLLLKSLPENERPLREAQLAADRGLKPEAIGWYRKAALLHPRDAGLQVALGHLLRESGLKPDALACYEKAIDLDEGFAWLGLSLSGDDPELAIACFRKAVQVHPGRDDLQKRLAMLLKSSGRLEEAIAALRVRIGQKPMNAQLHSELGDCLWDQGKRDEAFASYRTATGLDPGNERLLRLAILQAWFGRDKELAETTRHAAKLAREGTSPFRSALECYLSPAADAKQSQETLSLMRELVKASKNPYLWQRLTIGMGEHRTGDHAAAIETLREAAEATKNPTSGFKNLLPIADSYRAMALFRLGKKDEAKALLAEVAATMRPVPKDEVLTSQITHDAQQLLVWLSFKEAKALIALDAAPPPNP